MPKDNIVFEIALKCLGDSSGYYVSSDDVPGLHLYGKNLSRLKSKLETAIKTLFRDNRNVDVEVVWLADADVFPHPATFANKLAIYRRAA